MGLLDKLKFQLWDDAGAIVSLIEKWTPKKCTTEKDFEKSLYAYLHQELRDLQVTKQYAKGRIRADLVIANRVIVELKHNFDTTAKYQRLLGQLTEYRQWEGRIVVLLTGNTDTNLCKQLTEHVKEWTDGVSLLLGSKVTIVQK